MLLKAGLHSPLRLGGLFWRYFDAIGSLEKEAIPFVQSDVTVKKVEQPSTFFLSAAQKYYDIIIFPGKNGYKKKSAEPKRRVETGLKTFRDFDIFDTSDTDDKTDYYKMRW